MERQREWSGAGMLVTVRRGAATAASAAQLISEGTRRLLHKQATYRMCRSEPLNWQHGHYGSAYTHACPSHT